MNLSYEQRVLAWLHHTLLENDTSIDKGEKRITITEVRLEEKESEHKIIILFQEKSRLPCVFGFRALAHEPIPQIMPSGHLGDVNDPEGWAATIHANFYENMYAANQGLSKTCEEKEITWYDFP